MNCDKRKCEKCGLYWDITLTDSQGQPKQEKACAHMAQFMKLDAIERGINALRTDTHQRSNAAIEGMAHMINLKRIK